MRASTLTTCKILTIENFEAHIYWLVSPIISLVMDRKLIILFALFCQFQHESKKGKHSILLLKSVGCIRGYFQVLKTDSHFFWQEHGIVYMMPIKLDYGSFLTYCFAFWWAHSLKLVPQCYWYELDNAILATAILPRNSFSHRHTVLCLWPLHTPHSPKKPSYHHAAA